jgi:hypothetical protein
MRRSCLAMLLAVLAFCTCISSCAKPKYLIAGLTLPPGSSEVNTTTGNTSSSSGQPLSFPTNIPGMPNMQNSEYIMVTFNNSGGWSSVSSHFDSTLGKMGYSDSLKALMGANSVPGMPDFSSMRSYQKSGSKYMVMVMDMAGMMSAASAAAGTSMPPVGGVPGLGDYSLYVMKTQ